MGFPVKPVKALIFSVSIGAGHDSVAGALGERLLLDVPGSEYEIVDTFQYINSVLHKVVFGSYMETLKFTPKVWGYLYDRAGEGEMLVDLGQILSKLLSPKLEQLLKRVNPDVILTSHAFPTGILAVLKRRGQMKTPLAAVVTDYHVHSFWIHEGVDRYYIPSADLAYRLLQSGVHPSIIKGTGIPLRAQFAERTDTETARQVLGLPSRPTVLVTGGGLGLGRIEQITRELLNKTEFQVIVIAGKNNNLQEKLRELDNPRLKVFGFVDNITQVMSASDLIVSKPGGVTSAEVIAMGKPMIIFSSLPGQEDRNTDFLLNRGVALRIKKLETLVPEITSLWQNDLRRKHMKEMAAQLGSPLASKLIWEDLLTIL